MKNLINILGIIIGLFLLVLVRKYQTILFYDPFLDFFNKANFRLLPTPEFDTLKLIISIAFRFGLNTLISIIIIQLWFKNIEISKFSFYVSSFGFIIFTFLYLTSILTDFGLGYMPTFFIRRILIQPIFLFLLIPAIYYYKHLKKQKLS